MKLLHGGASDSDTLCLAHGMATRAESGLSASQFDKPSPSVRPHARRVWGNFYFRWALDALNVPALAFGCSSVHRFSSQGPGVSIVWRVIDRGKYTWSRNYKFTIFLLFPVSVNVLFTLTWLGIFSFFLYHTDCCQLDIKSVYLSCFFR